MGMSAGVNLNPPRQRKVNTSVGEICSDAYTFATKKVPDMGCTACVLVDDEP